MLFVDIYFEADRHASILRFVGKELKEQLEPDYLNYYASCRFNLGQIISLCTQLVNDAVLPLIESAVNLMEILLMR